MASPVEPPPRLAVMGAGRWGANLVRVCRDERGAELVAVVDPDEEARRRAGELAPGARIIDHIGRVISEVDAVVVCTPARDHEDHVAGLLTEGVDVLVEKPFALSTAGADALIESARRRGAVLMVGHQLLFHPAYLRLGELLREGAIGAPRQIEAIRSGPVDLGREEGALYCFGPHDVALISGIAGQEPTEVQARAPAGASRISSLERVDLSLGYADGLRATVHLEATGGDRVRRFEVRGERGSLVFDDGAPPGRLLHVDGSSGGGASHEVDLDWREPLAAECAHFVRCVRSRAIPTPGPEHARRVTGVLERAISSLGLSG